MTRQRAGLVILLQYKVETLRQALDLVRLGDGRNLRLATLAILACVEIERLDRLAPFFVETLTGLVAETAGGHLFLAQRFDAGRAQDFTRRVVRDQVVEIVRDRAGDRSEE